MHSVDPTTEQMIRSVLAYAENRLRLDPVPLAETLKLALVPGQLVRLTGPLETTRFSLIARVALLLAALPQIPLARTL